MIVFRVLAALAFDEAFDAFGGVYSEEIFLEDGIELDLRDADFMASVESFIVGDDVEFFLEIKFRKLELR